MMVYLCRSMTRSPVARPGANWAGHHGLSAPAVQVPAVPTILPSSSRGNLAGRTW